MDGASVERKAELGENFEREIREQPAVWERLAHSDAASRLAGALDGDVLLVGSGSSLFVAELGAIALRRRGIRAQALAATEARLDHNAYLGWTVIAVSQSGRSGDVLAALDILKPRRTIALTNSGDSPLAARADVTINVAAGREVAIPASKSVTAGAAVLLRAASVLSGDDSRNAAVLDTTARAIQYWLDSPAIADTVEAAQRIARRRSVIVLGSDYGLPVAWEMALKIKEASYLHAEGFAAGEFRHGSAAVVDATCAVIGIVDDDALPTVAKPMRDLPADAMRYTIGSKLDAIPRIGPRVDEAYNTLAWLVTAQVVALHAARARGVDSDAPRGLVKTVSDARG